MVNRVPLPQCMAAQDLVGPEEARLEYARSWLRTLFSVEEAPPLTPAGGMTNTSYHFRLEGADYILRIPGASTAAMIDRRREAVNNQWASDAGFNAPTVYFDPETGVKVTRRIPGAKTLVNPDTWRPEIVRETADLLKRLHTSAVQLAGDFTFLGELARYEALNRRLGGAFPPDYAAVRAQVMEAQRILEAAYGVERAPCHNDLAAQNLVQGEDRLYLIDWEYAGMNDPAWDLASHLLECEHAPQEADAFLTRYDPAADLPRLKGRVQIHMIFQDFLWSVWTWAKEAGGSDYGSYGADRYRRCQERLARLQERVARGEAPGRL